MADTAFLSNGFLNLVKPYLPYCPNELIELHLRQAAREFFRMSWVWRADHAAISLVANTATYALTVPAGREVRALQAVRLEGTRFEPVLREWLEGVYSDWQAQTAEKPSNWLMDNETTLRVWPKPTANLASAITFRMVLMPTIAATGIEDRMFNLYGDGIAHGALASLLIMPKKPWSAPDSAVIERQQFNRAWADAKIAADRDGTEEPVRIEFPPMP